MSRASKEPLAHRGAVVRAIAVLCFASVVYDRLKSRTFEGVLFHQLAEQFTEGSDVSLDNTVLPVCGACRHFDVDRLDSTVLFELI